MHAAFLREKRIALLLPMALLMAAFCYAGNDSGPSDDRDIAPPNIPMLAYVQSGHGALDVVWHAAQRAAFYEVAYSKTRGVVPPADAVVQTTTDTRLLLPDLVDGTTYYVWIKAVNPGGESNYNRHSATPRFHPVAPPPPSRLFVVPGEGQLTVSWPAVNWVTGYELYCDTAQGASTATKVDDISPSEGTVTATITGLANGTTYYVWVKSKNTAGTSSFTGSGRGQPTMGNSEW